MAAIGTIRKYSGVAVGFIGLSILTFIITDAFQKESVFFKKSKNNVGVIAGESITYQEFQQRVDIETEKYKKRQNVDVVTDEQHNQIIDQIWQKIQDEIIYAKEYEAVGINVSPEELSYVVAGPDPHPAVKQFFINDKKEFDRSILTRFLKNMDDYPDIKEVWLDFEGEIVNQKKREKYLGLVKGSINATNLEAKESYYAKNKFAGFEYVSLPFRDIPDSTIKFDEKDLKAYWEKHKKDNMIEETRIAQYVEFEIVPTSADTQTMFDEMVALKNEYKISTNDTLFVETRSEDMLDTTYHNPGFFPSFIDNAFFGAIGKDTVIGPFLDQGSFKIAKLFDKKQDSLTYYHASHILIKPKGMTDADTIAALAQAKTLMAEIRGGADFALKAMSMGEDGSASKGGDLGWFKEGEMVKPFMDAVKRGKLGDLMVVKTQFGAHVIKITSSPSRTVIKVGVISKKVVPSNKTNQVAYAKATKFRGAINSYKDFEKVINEQGLNKKITNEIKPQDKDIPGINSGKRLINWMYQAKVEDVSDILIFEDRYIVAALTEAYDKGPAPFEKVKKELEIKVIKEKKTELLHKKMQEALENNSTLDGLAKALKLKIDKVSDCSFDVPVVAGLGEEKLLIGYVFGSKTGQISEIIDGENGIYVFVVKSFSKVQPPKDLKESLSKMTTNLGYASQNEAVEALKEIADISDFRYKFY